MQDIIQQLIKQVEENQRLSNNTKQAYKGDLLELLEYIQETNTVISDINQTWTKSYLKHLEKTNKERNSYNRRASTFRTFLKFLYKNKLAPTNYSLIVNNLTTFTRSSADNLEPEDIQKIIGSTKLNKKDKLILLFIGKLGLTATQIAEIKTFQVDFEKKVISLSDNEKIYLPNEIFNELRDYMVNQRANEVDNNTLSLFLNESNEPVTELDIYKLIRNLSADLKLDKKLTARNLKRSFDNRIDVLSMQREIFQVTTPKDKF